VLELLSSEEQIPQIVVNLRTRRKTMEPLEPTTSIQWIAFLFSTTCSSDTYPNSRWSLTRIKPDRSLMAAVVESWGVFSLNSIYRDLFPFATEWIWWGCCAITLVARPGALADRTVV